MRIIHLEKGSERIRAIEREKETIEDECGASLEWQELEEKEASRIAQYTWDITDEEKWEEIFQWLKDRAETFHEVFSPRIKQIP